MARKALVSVSAHFVCTRFHCLRQCPTYRNDKAKSIFRDDDVAPTQRLNVLEAVNQVHIDEIVPVTLAIIPYPTANASRYAQLFPDDQAHTFRSKAPSTGRATHCAKTLRSWTI